VERATFEETFMRLRALLPALFLAIAVPAAWALDARTQRVIELKDGGRVVLRVDGAMSHYDATGIPVAMAEGTVMTAWDGSRIMMKGASLWREIIERATVSFALASTVPLRQDTDMRRVIELEGGGRIELQVDGTMIHFDAAGKRVRMVDGDAMTAADGTRILMNNGTLWGPHAARSGP